MCENKLSNIKGKQEYINIQTGEKLDWERVEGLKDNAMLKVKPELWCEWDFEKNNELGIDIWEVTKGSGKKVWWTCTLYHKWMSTVNDRYFTKKCPYCTNKKILIGFNDMWTTNPKLAKLLVNSEDGYKYMQGSGKYVDWKCHTCHSIVKNKRIATVKRDGLSCAKCSDGFSYPERYMNMLLGYCGIKFDTEKIFKWARDKRYDFYLETISLIIEIHGNQHYEKNGYKKTRTLQEEQLNDQLKETLARKNGIKHYVTIDARYSEADWIKRSVMESELAELFELSDVEWEKIESLSQKTIVKLICDEWLRKESYTTTTLGIKFGLSNTTVAKYLRKGSELGWCEYDGNDEQKRILKENAIKNSRKVVQLTLSLEKVCVYNSMSEAGNRNNISPSLISNVCSNKNLTSGGFRWMYKEDYDKYIADQNKSS